MKGELSETESEEEFQEEEQDLMQVDEKTASETSEEMGPYYEVGEKVFVIVKGTGGKRGKRKLNQGIEPIYPARVLSVDSEENDADEGEGRPLYFYGLQMYRDVSMKSKDKSMSDVNENEMMDFNDENQERFRIQLEHWKEENTPGSKKVSKHESKSKPSSKELKSTATYPNRLLSFKSEAYMKKMASQPRRQGKTFKQIISMDDPSNLPFGTPTYSSITAPPSVRSTRKYCDLTGLKAKYTHPRTNLRYASSDLYPILNQMDTHTVHAYLELRKANIVLI